jgi:aryl-alcohol dehydrogenase-like predicted oxidoreductase
MRGVAVATEPGHVAVGYGAEMKYRVLGRTGWKVSEISFGAWAIGGSWGEVDDRQSLEALHRAVDLGVNFFDTADVYGDGRSERLLARLKRERSEEIVVATKAGRRLEPHTAAGYNRANLSAFIDRSLQNLETDTLDLLQLHCPPTDAYYNPELFAALDDFVKQGKIRYYGVSVERVEEALKAIEYPGVQTVQIIFNMFRQRPAELFFEEAKKRKVGILARVPLASGLLSGSSLCRVNLPLTIIAPSIVRARNSIAAKHFPELITKPVCRRLRSCGRWSRRRWNWRNSRCDGS